MKSKDLIFLALTGVVALSLWSTTKYQTMLGTLDVDGGRKRDDDNNNNSTVYSLPSSPSSSKSSFSLDGKEPSKTHKQGHENDNDTTTATATKQAAEAAALLEKAQKENRDLTGHVKELETQIDSLKNQLVLAKQQQQQPTATTETISSTTFHGSGIEHTTTNTNTIPTTSTTISTGISDEIPQPVLHWNSTKRKSPPTIYVCSKTPGNGMREAKHIMSSVLPEYHLVVLSDEITARRPPLLHPKYYKENNHLQHQHGSDDEDGDDDYSNEYDVFLSIFFHTGFHDCSHFITEWLLKSYNGHFIFFSGESDWTHPIQATRISKPNFHAFGPIVDTHRQQDFALHYFQMVWWDVFREDLGVSALLDPVHRPRGNRTHYMIYANSNCVAFREEAVGRLSEFGVVHCDGKCQGSRHFATTTGNRTNNLIKTQHGAGFHHWRDNVRVYAEYRFCFVMEHTGEHPTYITEKILMAFIGGCIPIYYGTEKIFDVFNKKAFVFYNISSSSSIGGGGDSTNPQTHPAALDQVKALENNTTLYEQMMSEPIVANGQSTIEEYFSFDDTIGNGALKKRIRKKLGIHNLVP